MVDVNPQSTRIESINHGIQAAEEDQPQQQQLQPQAAATAHESQRKGAPFLEEALSTALSQLLAAREVAGKPKRRSRKRQRRSTSMGDNRGHYRVPGNFEEIFQKLVQYKEEHGDCLVSKNYMVDQQVSSCTALTNTVFLHGILCSIFLFICIDTHAHKLANWVRGIREKNAHMIKKGIDVEEVQPGKSILAKTLMAERIDKLNSIGFVWSVAGPKMLWEDRFRDCIEYYEMNGRWPSQSMGSLGEWVHTQ